MTGPREAMLGADHAGAPEVQRQRAAKHGLVDAVRRLAEAVALVDVDEAEPDDLDEVAADVHRITNRLTGIPSLGRFGGLHTAPSWNAALHERSPISGRANPVAPPLYLEADGELTRGLAVYGAVYEGPAGMLHGGWVAAAFDELLGVAQTASGAAGFTGTLTIRMRRPTPLYERIDYEGGVTRVEGRKIFAWGRSACDGEALCEAEGIFIMPRDGIPGDVR